MVSAALPVLDKVNVDVVGARQTVMPPNDKLDGVAVSATSTRGRAGSLLLIESVPLSGPTEAATKLGRKRTVTSTLVPGAILSGKLRSVPDGRSISCVTLNCGLLLMI